jgi:adenylate cyclase
MVRVKGKKEPVRIYELVGRAGQADPQTLSWIERFQQGLSAYRHKEWKDAIAHFESVHALKPEDAPANLYIERCKSYQHTPPPADWDGVYIMTTK